LDEAVEALRAGRLAFRVRHRDGVVARSAVASLGSSGGSFSLASEGSAALAGMMPGLDPAADIAFAADAGGSGSGSEVDSGSGGDDVAIDLGRVARLGVWVASVDATPTAIAAMREALGAADGVDVSLVVLPERVPDAVMLTPGTVTADTVSWWQKPATAWREMRPVPVIVDTRR
ncbi:MAG: hypothetical protein AAF235_08710, partial [Planctomycetota bacterium]